MTLNGNSGMQVVNDVGLWKKESPNKGPHVLITAGVHGDEYEPILAVHNLIEILDSKMINGVVTLVPVVNHSAYLLNQRCGSDGIDLARACPGNSSGSITERVASQISALIADSDYYIDLHTGGLIYNISPFAGYLLHESEEVLNKQQEMAKAFNLPVIWGTNANIQGRTLSVARDANIPAIYAEYGGGGSAQKEIVHSYQQGCLNILKTLGMIADDSDEVSKMNCWVEDYTPDNGNLQVKMPSPVDGIFQPSVDLGNIINKGDVWGEILNPINKKTTEVRAEQDGLVFLIRSIAKVKMGDSLGGVLPITKNGKVVIDG